MFPCWPKNKRSKVILERHFISKYSFSLLTLRLLFIANICYNILEIVRCFGVPAKAGDSYERLRSVINYDILCYVGSTYHFNP